MFGFLRCYFNKSFINLKKYPLLQEGVKIAKFELIGLLAEEENKPLVHTQLLRDDRLRLQEFILPPFSFQHLCLASLGNGFEFKYLAHWIPKVMLPYGKNAGYIREDAQELESSRTPENFIAGQILENRRYEVVGWLKPTDISGITRSHSATIEATADEEAVTNALEYSIPHYSWALRRVNKLGSERRTVIYEDENVKFLKEDDVFGDYYRAYGIISDADGHEHMEDQEHDFILRALTLEDAVKKAQNHSVLYYHWHFGEVKKLEGEEKERVLVNLRRSGSID